MLILSTSTSIQQNGKINLSNIFCLLIYWKLLQFVGLLIEIFYETHKKNGAFMPYVLAFFTGYFQYY